MPHVIPFRDTPVYRFLTETAQRSPQQTALVFFGQNTSYAALLDEAKRVGGGLSILGLKKGDRVAIMLPNCPQMVASYFGVLWAGGVVAGVNPLQTSDELLFQLNDSGARFIIGLDQFYPKIAQVFGRSNLEKIVVTGLQERLPFPKNIAYSLNLRRHGVAVRIPRESSIMGYRALTGAVPLEEPITINPKDDIAILVYTSGTTGRPKGVPLSHYQLAANCLQPQAWFPGSAGKQVTAPAIFPIFYIGCMTIQMNYGVSIGARLILLPRFEAGWMFDAIEKYRSRWVAGNPAMFDVLAKHKRVGRQTLASVEACFTGGAPLPAKVKGEFESVTGNRLLEPDVAPRQARTPLPA
ncbi:MAG: AMP-binding protein, partial [Chloroflexi bacterium]|nr:AMP-binding protein [Chloroflexota bacterium]